MKLDLRNKQILYELMSNCRQTSNQIGKKIRVSREVVDYRIKKLEKNGFIKEYVTLVDTDSLGFVSYNIHILLQNFDEKRKKKIIQYFKEHDFVKWIVTCSGRWDLIITLLAKDKLHFDDLISDIFTELGENLRDYYISTRIKLYKDADLLFINPKAKISLDLRKEIKKKLKFDKKDLEIIEILSENARVNIIDVAKKIKLTPEAASYRIKKLVKQQMIRGFRASINISKLDYLWYMLLLEVNVTKRNEKKIISFCNLHPNIFYVDKDIGKFNIRMQIMSKNQREFQNILEEIRNTFPEIKSYELLVIFKDYKQVSYVRGIGNYLK